MELSDSSNVKSVNAIYGFKQTALEPYYALSGGNLSRVVLP